MIKSLLDKEETVRANIDLTRSLFGKHLAFNSALLEVNNKIQQSCHLSRHTMLHRDELPDCQQKFA